MNAARIPSPTSEVECLYRDIVSRFTRIVKGEETIYNVWTRSLVERITLYNVDELLDCIFETPITSQDTETGRTWKQELLQFLFCSTLPYSPARHLRQIPYHLARYYAETGDESCYEEMNSLKNATTVSFYQQIGRRCDNAALEYCYSFSSYFFAHVLDGIEKSTLSLQERKKMVNCLREKGLTNGKLRSFCEDFRYRHEKIIRGSEDDLALLAYMESILN